MPVFCLGLSLLVARPIYWITFVLSLELYQMDKHFSLESGNGCMLLTIKRELIPNYYVLAFPSIQGEPTSSEVTEMLNIGIEYAQGLAVRFVGDAEAFSILYSGYSSRREKGWHIHIVLLGNRWKKAWLYLVLAGKNILQALGLRKDDSPRVN